MESSNSGISLGRVAVAAVVWAGAVAGAIALSSAVAQSSHTKASTTASVPTGTSSTPSGTSASTGTTSATPAPPFDPASVKPTDPRSLFRTANFARALRAVRSRYGDVDIGEVHLSPGEAQFTLLVAGEQRSVGVRANGQYVTLFERPLHGSAQAFTLSQVHANVPAALARRIAAHGGVPTAQLEYMLIRIDPAAHTFSWLVYRNGGDVHFQADGATSPITEYGSRGVRTLSG